jgi:hypothetical protein
MKEYFESYSNLAYSLVGLLVYLIHRDALVAILFVNLGVASYIFHYYKTKPIYLFDWWAMALINIGLVGYHFDNQWIWVLSFIGLTMYGYRFLGKDNVYKEVAFTAVPALIAIAVNTSIINALLVLCMFLLAIAVRAFDSDPKQAKFHDSVAHSVWHILTAVFYYFAFYPIL